MSKYKKYLGDGLYADFDGYSIIVTAEDGVSVLSYIGLEPEVFDALIKYREDTEKAFENAPLLWGK